jgi:hypothetical protein
VARRLQEHRQGRYQGAAYLGAAGWRHPGGYRGPASPEAAETARTRGLRSGPATRTLSVAVRHRRSTLAGGLTFVPLEDLGFLRCSAVSSASISFFVRSISS